MKKLKIKFFLFLSLFFFCTFSFSADVKQEELLSKINKVEEQEKEVVKEATLEKAEAVQIEQEQQAQISPLLKQSTQTNKEESSSKKEEAAPAIRQEKITEQKQEVKKENTAPKGVDWINLSGGKLNVKMQRRTSGISTPNLSMKFNNVYQSLFRNIPWLMGGKANVYVYQNRKNFLNHEAVASNWSGAFFSPENNRIVMYDEPNNINKMLSQFQHELTHLFVENYFSPKGSGKPEPPVWLNEGLAVNMEDIANNASGGVWARDLVVMTLLPSPKGPAADLKGPAPISDTTTQFIKFTDFIKNSSYDDAVAAGKVEDWYMQAYAMVRFLFKPYNKQYPENRIQFEQLTKLLNTYQNKKDSKGRLLKDEEGRQIKARLSFAAALKKAYSYSNIDDFERKFWQWLYSYQAEQRAKLNN